MRLGTAELKCARCDVCPLRAELVKTGDWRPVPAEIHEGADTILVKLAPDKQEAELYGRPFATQFGAEITEMLQDLKRPRKAQSYTHVVACRFPKDDEKAFMARWKKRNRQLKSVKEAPIPSPYECCRPRLDAELQLHDNVISFGPEALAELGVDPRLRTPAPTLDGKKSAFRGFPTYTAGMKKYLPTVDSMMYDPRWTEIVRQDLSKAIRHFEDKLDWTDPKIIHQPTAEQIRRFHERLVTEKQYVSVDVETKNYSEDDEGDPLFDPMMDKLRLVGVGTRKLVLISYFLSVTGRTDRFIKADGTLLCRGYKPEELPNVWKAWADLLTDPRVVKVGHNAGTYDTLNLLAQYGFAIYPLLDTIDMHKLGFGEFRHRLLFVASQLLDVGPWKAEHAATEATDDETLGIYNARDNAVQHAIVPQLKAQMVARSQRHLYSKMQIIRHHANGMHRIGMPVSEDRRRQHEDKLEALKKKQLEIIFSVTPELNPNSFPQIANHLYDTWELPIPEYTDTGEPSTNDVALRTLQRSPVVDAEMKPWIKALRKYREYEKLLNTYVRKLRRGGPFVSRDGWIYPDLLPHGTVGWRYAGSNPNFQNIPNVWLVEEGMGPGGTDLEWNLRDIFIAPDGWCFVAADADQLELRFFVARSQARAYLQAFVEGTIDPHNLTGQIVFGPKFWELQGAPEDPTKKGKGRFKQRRDLVKRLIYLMLYGGEALTMHENLQEAEDKHGDPEFPDIGVKEVRAIRQKILRANPEFEIQWAREMQFWRNHGYVEEPIWGLRRYIQGAERDVANEVYNFDEQAGGAAIIHKGMMEFTKKHPWIFEKRHGLCLQVHDQLLFLANKNLCDPEEVKASLQACLTQQDPFSDMTYTAEAHVGQSWAEV